MNSKSTLGLSILAGGLAFVGSANATDLLVNGSFEQPPGTGWVGSFGSYNYSAAYFSGPAIPQSEHPGDNYSWRHGRSDTDFSGPLTQTVSLSSVLTDAQIDSALGQFTFSAWMASYTDPERPYITLQFFDTSGTTQVGGTTVFDRTAGANFTTFADGVTVFDNGAHEGYWAKYVRTAAVPIGARSARVGITRSPNAGVAGRPDTYVDLVKLDVQAVAAVPPSVDSAQPTGGNVRPDAVIKILLEDGSTQVNTDSIQLKLDGATVAPSVVKSGTTTTVQYDPPGLLAPASTHNYRIVFSDNGVVPASQTNDFSFTISRYYPIVLPSPIYLETFDTTPEGSLPADWQQISYSALPDPNCDTSATAAGGLQDLNSACYGKWTVVSSARFQSPMLTYNDHNPETDYQRVLTVNPLNVVNGAVVENLAQNNIAFGDSGYRDGNSQVVYLFSKDFDLTGRSSVYLVFNSLWEQNQDSVGAVEYSTDGGNTWLPIVYYVDGPDVIRDGSGNIDGYATFVTPHSDSAIYIDPADNLAKGGYYGAFIGVESNRWSMLGPFISPRVDDNPKESKRVEVFRLDGADNASTVRLRFAHAGADSWYFGIDNVGLYTLTSVAPPLVTISPAEVTERAGNTVLFSGSAFGIGPFTYRWQHNGSDIPNETNTVLSVHALNATAAGTYTLVVGYPGGTTNGSTSVTVIEPDVALVTGQWDFDGFDLRATVGQDLDFYDDFVATHTGFTDTEFDEIPNIDGQIVNCMKFSGAAEGVFNGYKMFHGILPNGGGANVNEYTLIMDVLYPEFTQDHERALLQTNPNNSDNRDAAIGANNGLGVTGGFDGHFLGNTWQRVAIAVDLSGPGPHPIMAKFINGVKVGQQVLTEGADARWSLKPASDPSTPWGLLFADDNVDVQPGYVSSIQIRNGRLADAQIARLGGPTAKKIAGAVRTRRDAGQLIIEWTGGVPLQSATQLTGPWDDVPGAISPYTVPGPLGGAKYYRPKL